MRRWLFKRAYKRYQQMTFASDAERLSELINLFKQVDWFHTIYHPRSARSYYIDTWYMNAYGFWRDLHAWHSSLSEEDVDYIKTEEFVYANLGQPQSLYRWLTDNEGHVISYAALMGDVVEYGRVLAAWLEALHARDDPDASYCLRKTRKLTHDCCKLLTFAADRYVGAL